MLKIKLISVLIIIIQSLGFSQWEEKNISTPSILTSVVFQNEAIGFVVGGNEVFKTEDGGDTWETVHTAPDLVIYEDVLIIEGEQIITVGFDFNINEAIITRSIDNGIIWTDATTSSFSALKAAFFPSSTIGYCSGGGGAILKTTDAGATWQTLNTGVNAGLNSIYFIDELVGIAVGGTPISSTIIKTQDGGNTWSEIESPSTNNLQSIHFSNDQTAYAVGWNGEIMITENCGDTWTLQNSVTMQGNLEVLFIDDNTGYIVGGDLGESIIQRTDNAGGLWEDISPDVQQGLVGIHFPSSNLGYAVGSFGTVLKTDSGGLPTSTHDLIHAEDFTIFPNPTSGLINIQSNDNSRIDQVIVYNSYGQIIREMNVGNVSMELDLSNFEADLYYLQVNTTNSSFVRSLVVSR